MGLLFSLVIYLLVIFRCGLVVQQSEFSGWLLGFIRSSWL